MRQTVSSRSSHPSDRPSPSRAARSLVLAACALLALGACGGNDRLEGADTAGAIPNAAGFEGPTNYDTAASPGGPDSALGQHDTDRRPPGMAGDTMSVRPTTP